MTTDIPTHVGELVEKVQNEAEEAMMLFSDALEVLDTTSDELSILDMLGDIESIKELSGNLVTQWKKFMVAVSELEQQSHSWNA